jgi:hypothetical protein
MDGRKNVINGSKIDANKGGCSSIPVFAMIVFNIPEKICKGITMLFCNYSGVMMITTRRCIGWLGEKCVSRKRRCGFS